MPSSPSAPSPSSGVVALSLALALLAPAPARAANFGAKFEPPAGQIYSGAGQSPIAIMQMTNKGSQSRKPMIAAAYDSLDDTTTYSPGQSLYEAHNYYPGAKL
ncbi:MAG: hypothetical protein RLZZ15_4324, partial [Verrucomicrobiota bacterium]